MSHTLSIPIQVKSSSGATRPRGDHPGPASCNFLPPALRGLRRSDWGRPLGEISAGRPATVTGPAAVGLRSLEFMIALLDQLVGTLGRITGGVDVKSSQVVGLRDRVAIIRTLIFSSPRPLLRGLWRGLC